MYMPSLIEEVENEIADIMKICYVNSFSVLISGKSLTNCLN